MPSEIAMSVASIYSEDAAVIKALASDIDITALSFCKPLVEAVLKFKRNGTPDNRTRMYAEARKLKEGEHETCA